ncbi:MAG TPA: HIT domain-containing protein [Friedmanniella sp.]
MSEPECLICAKHRGEGPLQGPVSYADDLVVVSHRADGLLGHAFVETRRHVRGVEELTDAEAEAVGRLATRLARSLGRELGALRVHTFVAGLHVDHFHQHVLAVPPGTPASQPWWSPWNDGPRGDVVELAEAIAPELA